MHPPAALRRTLTVTITLVTFASGAAAPGSRSATFVPPRTTPSSPAALSISSSHELSWGDLCETTLGAEVGLALGVGHLLSLLFRTPVPYLTPNSAQVNRAQVNPRDDRAAEDTRIER